MVQQMRKRTLVKRLEMIRDTLTTHTDVYAGRTKAISLINEVLPVKKKEEKPVKKGKLVVIQSKNFKREVPAALYKQMTDLLKVKDRIGAVKALRNYFDGDMGLFEAKHLTETLNGW